MNFEKKVQIMGILNVTPDSFSDGGKYFDAEKAVAQALKMIRDGADIIDVGGESTGPGSLAVTEEEELKRVIPVIEKIKISMAKRTVILSSSKDTHGARSYGFDRLTMTPVLSVDTYKAQIAQSAICAGASMVNDVTALRGDTKMASLIAKTGVKVVLMYSKDSTPRTTREPKQYADVIKTVSDFLEERIAYALNAGIKKSQIIIDPGMGAFVSGEPKYSLEILRRLGELKRLGCPILVGASRKSFLPGAVADRSAPTFIANLVAAKNGADILRVHRVLPNVF